MLFHKTSTYCLLSLSLLSITPSVSYATTPIQTEHPSSDKPVSPTSSMMNIQLEAQLAALEQKYGGRIGISLINTKDNSVINYRANERFPFASTFKVMAVAAILKMSESNSTLLTKRVFYTEKQVKDSGYAPITSKHIQEGMTIEALCAAALSYSDNTAVNLLMTQLGGPSHVTAFARSIHDNSFNLTRWEPKLNLVYPGETQDTTTPAAMSSSLKKLVLGGALQKPQRERLKNGLINNTTGNTKIRASLPSSWVIGDKTGSGSFGGTNDIAVIWPKNAEPLVLSIYYVQKDIDAKHNDHLIREITHSIFNIISK